MPMLGAKADPCAALFGQMKKECEDASGATAGAVTGVTSGVGSIWDFLTKPQMIDGGVRHLFVRIAEGVLGGLLIIVGVNALIKSETGTDMVKKAKGKIL